MIAITNGKIVTVTGETYENGTVLVKREKSPPWEPMWPFPPMRKSSM